MLFKSIENQKTLELVVSFSDLILESNSKWNQSDRKQDIYRSHPKDVGR